MVGKQDRHVYPSQYHFDESDQEPVEPGWSSTILAAYLEGCDQRETLLVQLPALELRLRTRHFNQREGTRQQLKIESSG